MTFFYGSVCICVYIASVVAPVVDEITEREYNTSDSITCSAEGLPPPRVTWTRISGTMPEYAGVPGESRAVLRNLENGEHTWKCTARNMLGSESITVTFTGAFCSLSVLIYYLYADIGLQVDRMTRNGIL